MASSLKKRDGMVSKIESWLTSPTLASDEQHEECTQDRTELPGLTHEATEMFKVNRYESTIEAYVKRKVLVEAPRPPDQLSSPHCLRLYRPCISYLRIHPCS